MGGSSDYHALIVDDEGRIRSLAARALMAEDITSDVAADGQEALGQFDPQLHDLVITDLRMPQLHGHALVVELLNREPAPNIFVLTGVAEPRLVKDLLARGVLDVAIKPVDFKMFAAKVRSRMDANRAMEDRRAQQAKESRHHEHDESERPLDTLEKIELHLISGMTRMPLELLAELVNYHVAEDIEVSRGVKDFVRRQAVLSPYGRNDRRKFQRVSTLFPIICAPYDEDFKKVGKPFHGFLRDISESGVGIVTLRSIDQQYLALGWTNGRGQGIRAFAEITRCRAYESLYDIGGVFVKDL